MARIFINLSIAILVICLALSTAASESKQSASPQLLLASLLGNWEGTCKTWFTPGKLADESRVEGSFEYILGEHFLRHSYVSQLRGKPRGGEELLAFNPAQNQFQTSWVDDFHMNYGIMFSEGEGSHTGFTVIGKYAVGDEHPPWSWKTVYELIDDNHLTITAYNISPDGDANKAVETKYTRVAL